MSFGKGQSWSLQARLSGRFAAGFVISSVTIFGLAATIGVTTLEFLSSETQKFATYAVLCAALLLDAYSLKTKRWCPVTLRRQTPKAILQQHGARRAALAWTLGSSSRRSV